jgi:hypothetical protein
MWLGEARRTGRGFVVGCPCVDPLECCDECPDDCDYHRKGKECDGGTVAVPLVAHEGGSALEWKRSHGLDSSRAVKIGDAFSFEEPTNSCPLKRASAIYL